MVVTRAVYAVEDAFEKLPIHWMWWPALGGIVVGGVGVLSPHTMGVGYDNIEHVLSGELSRDARVVIFYALKFVSWALSLGTGTSGGTLAPLFTIGGGLGSAIGTLVGRFVPSAGVDARVAALVGMAAVFAGASRALLASVVFAFETTRQPMSLLPLLGGCTAAYLVSLLTMRHSIMTEKIARRGARVVSEYTADFLAQILVSEIAAAPVVVVRADDTCDQVRSWIAGHAAGSSHQGFPVVDETDRIVGVVTRRDLLGSGPEEALSRRSPRARPSCTRRPAVVFADSSRFARRAITWCASAWAASRWSRATTRERVIGMLTRSDLIASHSKRLDAEHRGEPRYTLLGRRDRQRDAQKVQTGQIAAG